MPSNINIDNIDATFPTAGISNDSQGFRNNFSNIKDNVGYAKREIEDLQNKAVLKSALTGTVINNNMNGSPFNAAEVFDLRETEFNAGIVTGTYVLDHSIAHYHSLITNGSITIGFTNLPDTGKAGRFRLKINLTNINHRITIPQSVTQGTSGILGFDQFNYSITFISAGVYVFEFFTVDNGTNFHVHDLTRGSTLAAPTYILPSASGSILGGIKVGTSLSINGSGVLNYTLPTASGLVLGGIKIGDPAISGNLFVDSNSALNLLPASATILGGVKVGSGLTIDGGVLSIPPPPQTYFNYTVDTASPKPGSASLYGDGTGKITGFNAYRSTDFPATYVAGITVAGFGTGAQLGMGWDTSDGTNVGGGAGGTAAGAPKLMYFRTRDDNAPGDDWSPWTRIVTQHDLSDPSSTVVGSGGLQFAHDPGGGAGDWAWIKYFAYSGEKTNLEIGVSNDGFEGSGAAQDSINLVSPGGVGVNRQQPLAMLDVNGAINAGGITLTNTAADLPGMTNESRWPLEIKRGGIVLTDTSDYGNYIDFRDSSCIGTDRIRGNIFFGKDGNLRFGNSPVDAAAEYRMTISPDGLVGIPTVPTATAGTTARLAVSGLVESTTGGFKFPDGTVQTSAAGSTSYPLLQGVNGYQKLPNGFIIQWGQHRFSFDSSITHPDNPPNWLWTEQQVYFPIAFPTYCASVQIQGDPYGPGVDWATVVVQATTTTQFKYVFYDSVQNFTAIVGWMAIGY